MEMIFCWHKARQKCWSNFPSKALLSPSSFYYLPTMPKVRYTLDAAIESFFSHSRTSATRAQCDQFASKFGGPVEPVQVQGINSYTVTAGGHKIVQFREATSQLDMKSLGLARQIHGDVVAQCVDHGWIGTSQESGLAIYEMDRLPGQNYILVRYSLAEAPDLQLNTVHSLARFVDYVLLPWSFKAAGILNNQDSLPTLGRIEYQRILRDLLRSPANSTPG